MIAQPEPALDDTIRGAVQAATVSAYARTVELSPGWTLIQGGAMPGHVIDESVAGGNPGDIGEPLTLPAGPNADSSVLGVAEPH